MTEIRPRILALAVTLCALATPGLAAQEAPSRGVALSGAVIDAAVGTPMAGATVVLEPEVVGAFPGSAAGSGFAAAARTTRTDALGRYRFDDLSPGAYRLYAARYGYRPYTVVVELGRGGVALSVGLEADPIALEPVRSRAHARGPYAAADPFAADPDLARLLVADLRRRRFLTTDVRELTHADVVEGVTLGEPDLFRALQRLPGVTTRSDYTASLWTRGAPWSQTRVYYDGIPVFNPLHALGMISGISSTAVGTVWFHPGVRPAGMGGGASGVIDLRSRPAVGVGTLNVQADASLATAGLALDQRILDGRAGWMLAGRRSYLDWLTGLARRAAGQDDAVFPYHFAETSGRVDAEIASGHTLEASWLWEGDELTSEEPEAAAEPLRATWGNALGRLTWSGTVGDLNIQHTVGGSRHHGLVGETGDDLQMVSRDAVRQSETEVRYGVVRGGIWPIAESQAGPPWSFGYEVARHDVRYHGPIPLPVPRSEALNTPIDPGGPYQPLDSVPLTWEAELAVASAWLERTWTPTEALTIRGGLRVETSAEVRDALPVRPAPRLAVRYAAAPELALSAGYARVYQYSQAVAPGGLQLASLVSTDAWFLAGPGVPAITSDMVTAGVEAWVAPGRLATINGFARHATGIVMPNPEPGPVAGRAPAIVAGINRAMGVEASVRQLTGPLTGSISYSLTRSVIDALALEFTSAADRTHVLNATGLIRPLPSLRVGAAFTAATGVPFTRVVNDADDCATEPGCDPESLPWAGTPNATRGPAYASLDLLVDWSVRVRGLDVGVYGQLRNVLGRENATVYTGGSGCLVVGCSTEELRSAYERGVPRLPVLGIRVRR